MDDIIKLDNVSYRYQSDEPYVVKNLSVGFKRGSFNAVLGHNGSGKSTVARLLNGLLLPSEGTVTVDGLNTADEENELETKKRVGLVFQNPDNQMVASIVEDDVAFGPENLGIPTKEIRTRVDNALKTVDMYNCRRKAPHMLSGGQKQRVAIAGILAMQPQCIVLDEPTAMLDPMGRQEVMSTLLKLNREQGITVILITHYMDEAALSDRTLVMNDGVIVADTEPKKLFGKVELLQSAGLSVPQTAELAYKLKKHGIDLGDEILSEEACAEALTGALKRHN